MLCGYKQKLIRTASETSLGNFISSLKGYLLKSFKLYQNGNSGLIIQVEKYVKLSDLIKIKEHLKVDDIEFTVSPHPNWEMILKGIKNEQ